MNKFNIPDIWRLIISIALCQLAGIIGSIFSTPAIPTWYASLNKPPFSPPNWVFGPLWITLFVLMGI
ncbi:tryptophan-rich sensory protein, partial [candidate division WOR-3 bacterium]|nr:tryptophan-rich sensory protein [candidate division WOR-3 bacterium]